MKKQGFIIGSVILALSAAVSKILGAVFRIPLSSLLGGTGTGYFSSAYGIFLPIYAVTAAGLPAAAARITARNISSGGGNLAKIKKTALCVFTLVGIAGTAVILLGAGFFCNNIIHSPMSLPSVIMIAPSVLFGCPCAVLRGYCEGQRNMIPTALSQLAEAAVKLAAGLFGAYYVMYLFDNDRELLEKITNITDITKETALCLSSAAAAAGVSLSVMAGLLFMLLYDFIQGGKTGHESTESAGKVLSEREIVRELMSVAIPASLCSLVTSVTTVIDLVTVMNSLRYAVSEDLSAFSHIGIRAEEIPNYMYGCFSGLAVTVFNLFPSVTNMFGRGILPAASEAYEKKDRKAFAENVGEVFTAVSFICIPCAFGTGALSREILLLLFGGSAKEAVIAAPSLAALSPAIILLSVSSAIFPVFQSCDRQDIPVKLMAAGAAVKAAGNLLLVRIPSLNITGAALSTDISYLAIAAGTFYYLKKITDTDFKDLFTVFLKLSAAGTGCAVTAKITVTALQGHLESNISVLLSILAGGIFYIIITYFEGIFSKSTLKMLICKKNKKNT